MAEPHLDHPGEIRWSAGQIPHPVLGPCPHDCRHLGGRVVADGPSLQRYELLQCGTLDGDGCRATCRAWCDVSGRITTAWLHVNVRAATGGGA